MRSFGAYMRGINDFSTNNSDDSINCFHAYTQIPFVFVVHNDAWLISEVCEYRLYV